MEESRLSSRFSGFPLILQGESICQWDEIFQGSPVTEPQSWGQETNYPLLVRLLDALRRQVNASPVALFQGDILAHKFRESFFELYPVIA